jgi:hypothetical protein
MSSLSTQELFDLLKSKVILNLKPNEIACPTCNGLRMNFRVSETSEGIRHFIEQCTNCSSGVLYICEHCGDISKNNYCTCTKACEARNLKYQIKEQEKRSKATIIKFSDYKGFLTDPTDDEHIIEYDDFADIYLDNFTPDSPKFAWAMNTSRAFHLDLDDIIQDKCEDQWEGLYDNLNTRDPLILQAQGLLNEWLDKEDPTDYSESSKVLVDLSELYEQGMKDNQFNEGE